MKFEIPFDKDIYDEQTKLQFDRVWSKGFNKNKDALYSGLISLIFGIIALYAKGDIGYFFIVMGLFFLYRYYQYYSHYKRNKKRYFSESEILANEQSEINDISVWEFNEDYLRYKCFKCDFKIDWSLFTEFEIINDNIFIKTKDVNHSYILGKSEVGNSEFYELVEFLKTKIKESDS